MNNKIYKRIKEETRIILDSKCTIRELAKKMNISKSTVHKDLHERLLDIDKNMYNKVKEILEYHIKVRHINGGEATRLKYLMKRGE